MPTISAAISMTWRVAPAEAIDQQSDADHLAGLERVRKAEEGHRRHRPRGEVVAGRNVEAELAAGGQPHHQEEDGDQEQAREPARAEIQPVEQVAYEPYRARAPVNSPTTPTLS